MSRQSGRRPSGQGSNGGLRNLTLGGGTIGLCVATVVMTLLYVFVPSLQDALVIEPATADQLSLLSVVTNSFVAARGSLFGLLILFALIGYFVWPQLQSLWRRSPGFIISASLVILVTVLGLDFALGRGRGVGLVSALVPLMWFAGTIESRWGEKRLLMFTGIVIVVVNGFGLLVAYAFPGSFGSLAGSKQRTGLRHRSDGERTLDGVVFDVCTRQARHLEYRGPQTHLGPRDSWLSRHTFRRPAQGSDDAHGHTHSLSAGLGPLEANLFWISFV